MTRVRTEKPTLFFYLTQEQLNHLEEILPAAKPWPEKINQMFEIIYDSFIVPLARASMTKYKDYVQFDAEDVAQELIIHVLNKPALSKMDGVDFLNSLKKILRENSIIDRIRKENSDKRGGSFKHENLPNPQLGEGDIPLVDRKELYKKLPKEGRDASAKGFSISKKERTALYAVPPEEWSPEKVLLFERLLEIDDKDAWMRFRAWIAEQNQMAVELAWRLMRPVCENAWREKLGVFPENLSEIPLALIKESRHQIEIDRGACRAIIEERLWPAHSWQDRETFIRGMKGAIQFLIARETHGQNRVYEGFQHWMEKEFSSGGDPSMPLDLDKIRERALAMGLTSEWELVKAYFLERYTFAQIGQALGVETSTAHYRIQRALNKLRETVE